MSRLHQYFGAWQIRKNIVSPVLVNVITALILFVVVVVFKQRVLTFLGIWKGVEGYPIYCVAEPYSVQSESDPNSKVHVDLFIINLEDKRFGSSEELRQELRKIVGTEKASIIGTSIKLRTPEDDSLGSIIGIVPDQEFNNGKGIVKPLQLKENTWEITIEKIENRGILKLTVLTNCEAEYITRASRALVPFTIEYSGRK